MSTPETKTWWRSSALYRDLKKKINRNLKKKEAVRSIPEHPQRYTKRRRGNKKKEETTGRKKTRTEGAEKERKRRNKDVVDDVEIYTAQ